MSERTASDLVYALIPKHHAKPDAYRHGYDCGKHGANETNCHFSIFSSPENTRAWERGRDAAIAEGKAQP